MLSIFREALKLLEEKQHAFTFMEDHIMPLSAAPEGYELFERHNVFKVVLDAQG